MKKYSSLFRFKARSLFLLSESGLRYDSQKESCTYFNENEEVQFVISKTCRDTQTVTYGPAALLLSCMRV